ncbi:MAG: response regulator transcription factor [Clostridium sp.]|uniref:response regulator transcription factor n=1 Tax=Clostridium culturomicium TaxID=1499683 RepID=UPI0005900A2C|nr:response regulator transcription factor [Clostridium culturomicium]MDU4891598.1 response regulator transcription factor [Clostridium sp.]MDU7085309.1 response regulator transcription factor [Clostridium sp.]
MNNVNILLVDDEENIRNLLGAYLKKEGYNIFHSENGVKALEVLNRESIQLIILDIMMPVMDGFETLKHIRNKWDIPVIMLSAKAEDEDKLFALGFGADNYETKPFSPKVLVAKIKALIKRIYVEPQEKESGITIEDLYIDAEGHRVTVSGEDINLSPTEFSLFVYFLDNKNIVLSREQILTKIWGYDFEGDIRVVDTTIKRLREKLKHMNKLIVTVRGFGYKVEV